MHTTYAIFDLGVTGILSATLGLKILKGNGPGRIRATMERLAAKMHDVRNSDIVLLATHQDTERTMRAFFSACLGQFRRDGFDYADAMAWRTIDIRKMVINRNHSRWVTIYDDINSTAQGILSHRQSLAHLYENLSSKELSVREIERYEDEIRAMRNTLLKDIQAILESERDGQGITRFENDTAKQISEQFLPIFAHTLITSIEKIVEDQIKKHGNSPVDERIYTLKETPRYITDTKTSYYALYTKDKRLANAKLRAQLRLIKAGTLALAFPENLSATNDMDANGAFLADKFGPPSTI